METQNKERKRERVAGGQPLPGKLVLTFEIVHVNEIVFFSFVNDKTVISKR